MGRRKETKTMTLRERLKKAEALARRLETLDRRHDEKCRKIESRAANQKLAVAAWLGDEREKLLAAADPEARAMVLAGEGVGDG